MIWHVTFLYYNPVQNLMRKILHQWNYVLIICDSQGLFIPMFLTSPFSYDFVINLGKLCKHIEFLSEVQ